MRSQSYLNPRVSGTGQVVVETLSDDGTSAVWIYDLEGAGAIRPLAQQDGNNSRPIWTPKGERVTFTSDRGGTPSIWWQPADGSGAAEPLTVAEEGTEHWATSWSPDGRTLAFTVAARNAPEESAIWTLSLDRPEEPELYYDVSGSPEDGALFSPDGEWLAYWSREVTGDNQVWIQPFPRTGANRHRLTEDGGTYPIWSRDGRRLYYRRPFGSTVGGPALNAIDVELGTSPAWGTERTMPPQGFLVFNWHRDYDIAPDGRFLMVFPTDADSATAPERLSVNIVLNWFEELKRLAPVD
jgi:Tol biopolymer transport system component